MSLFGKNRPQRHPVSDRHDQHFDRQNCKDRIFQGQKPLAHLEDLKALHGQVLRWLMGPGNDFGPLGYVPLSEDGKTIDPSYIREEFVGVDVFNNAELMDKNAKTLQFRGNLVKAFKDTDGKIVIYIKQKTYSRVGTFDGLTDGNFYLTPECRDRFTKMIAPIGPSKYYAGLEPGQQFAGFVANGTDTDIFTWETIDKVLFANNKNTYLVVSLLDAEGNAIFTVESAKITQNTTNIIMGDNRYCSLEVFEFAPIEANEYGGKLRLKINLAAYFNKSSKFSVRVTHYNSQFRECITTWNSHDYFYCTGKQLSTEYLDINAKIDYDYDFEKDKVWGLTYINDGYVKFTVTGIHNINNGAIAPVKLKFETNLTDETYEFEDRDMNYHGEMSLLSQVDNVTWSHTFKIKENLFYPLETVSAKITLSNGFCTVEKTWENLKVKNQTYQAYINTYPSKYITDKANESFEGKRIAFGDNDFGIPELFNIDDLLQNPYLQVIQKYGLVWPNLFGITDANYKTRYYRRNFGGSDTDTSLVWGGTFTFGNFTAKEFFAKDFDVRISMTEGQVWYNLKEYKDGRDPLGILCKVTQVGDNLEVRFALPENTFFNHESVIQFELSMGHTNKSRITFIKLTNEDNTQVF